MLALTLILSDRAHAISSDSIASLDSLKRIVISVAAGPARGNTGAAVIAANQLRRAGFTGEIIVLIPQQPWVREVFATMVRGYDPNTQGIQSVGLPSARFKAINWEVNHQQQAISLIQTSGPVDLTLSFGDPAPTLLSRNSRITITSENFVVGILGIESNLPGALKRFNFFGSTGRLGAMGYYGDDVVERAMEVMNQSSSGALAVLRGALGLLRQEDDKHNHFAQAAEFLAQSQNAGDGLAMIYGVGNIVTHSQFAQYIQGADRWAQANGRRAILFTVSQLTPEELTGIQSLAGVPVIDMQRSPDAFPVLPVSRAAVIHVGGIPREIYGRLLAISELPAVVSGDSATSAAIMRGKPFVMTTDSVLLNKIVEGDIRQALESVGATDVIAQWHSFRKKGALDWNILLSEASKRAFAQIPKLNSRPLSVALAELASMILSDPATALIKLEKLQFDALKQIDCGQLLVETK